MLALAALVLTMAHLALGHHRLLGGVWAVPIVVAAVGLAAGLFTRVERLAVGLVVIEAGMALVLALSLRLAMPSGTVWSRDTEARRVPSGLSATPSTLPP